MGVKNNFFSGITEILMLAILNDHDSYVYEMVKYIQAYSEGCLTISQNTIYAVTYKLENEGKITQYSKLVGKRRTRIYYHLEPEGKEYYTRLLSSFKDACRGVDNILSTLNKNKEDNSNE